MRPEAGGRRRPERRKGGSTGVEYPVYRVVFFYNRYIFPLCPSPMANRAIAQVSPDCQDSLTRTDVEHQTGMLTSRNGYPTSTCDTT
jgi:hypothetical protein